MLASSTAWVRKAKLLSIWLGLLVPSVALASGGMNSGIGTQQPQPNYRVPDERYEYGKALFLGRLPDSPKLSYCVLEDDVAKKLKRRTLKPFRRQSKVTLANALVHCDEPGKLALASLERGQAAFVLYYLDKRYRLKLSDS